MEIDIHPSHLPYQGLKLNGGIGRIDVDGAAHYTIGIQRGEPGKLTGRPAGGSYLPSPGGILLGQLQADAGGCAHYENLFHVCRGFGPAGRAGLYKKRPAGRRGFRDAPPEREFSSVLLTETGVMPRLRESR